MGVRLKEKLEKAGIKKETITTPLTGAVVPNVDNIDKDYINISKYSDDEVGIKLAPGYGYQFNTIFGKVGSIRNIMDFLNNPGYPIDILSKKKLTSKDVNKVSKMKKINIPNYWAIMVYVFYERLVQDQALLDELINLPEDIIFTSFNEYVRKSPLGEVRVKRYNTKMGRYIKIIELLIEEFRKDRNFDVKGLVESCKDKPHKDLFDSLAVKVEL